MIDYHMHLERGPLTLEWLQRFLDRATAVGIEEVGVTEHLYRFREARDILWTEYIAARSVNCVDDYAALMERARAAGLPVRFGLEADYVPGKERETARVLALFPPLDYVIGSVHWLGSWGFDLDAASWQGKSVADVYREYYATLARAAECELFDIIGHPGNIAYHGFKPAPEFTEELEQAFLARAARQRVVLEINTGGLLRPARELFPRPELARRIVETGLPITTASDAHRPEDVGHAFPLLYRQLKEWGVKEVIGFAGRQRVPYQLADRCLRDRGN